jgi:hypothetical protein
VERGEAVVELGDGASTDDGRGDCLGAEGPLEGEVVEGRAVGRGEVAKGLDLVLLGENVARLEESFGAAGAGFGGDAIEVFRGEHALGERAEDDAADAFFLKIVEDSLRFGPAVEDGVGRLIDEAADAHLFEDADGFFEFLERVFREADVECLAAVDGGGEGGHGFLEAGVWVGPVGVEDVDIVQAEALERLVEGGEEVFA